MKWRGLTKFIRSLRHLPKLYLGLLIIEVVVGILILVGVWIALRG